MKITLDLEKIMNQQEPRFSRNLDDIAGCLDGALATMQRQMDDQMCYPAGEEYDLDGAEIQLLTILVKAVVAAMKAKGAK